MIANNSFADNNLALSWVKRSEHRKKRTWEPKKRRSSKKRNRKNWDQKLNSRLPKKNQLMSKWTFTKMMNYKIKIIWNKSIKKLSPTKQTRTKLTLKRFLKITRSSQTNTKKRYILMVNKTHPLNPSKK